MKKFTRLFCVFCMLVMSLAACGKPDTDDGVKKFYNSMNDTTEAVGESTQSGLGTAAEENGKSVKKNSDILIVSDINSANETIRVYNYSTGVQYQYYYGLTTGFFDKYGNHMSVSDIHQGDVVDISGADSDGKAKRIQKSDKVWTNDTVTNFSVDKDKSMLEIGSSSYRLGERTMIFSGSEVIDTDSLTAQDKLSVVGIDKNIVSISVTTGHGTLQLSNTSLFEGSFLQLGDRIFAEITPDMSLDVPEGSYTLAVANNGWGDSTDIEIKRGEITKVNLNDLKGEGPKKSSILFEVDVQSAKIYVDGSEIDYTSPVEITYGKHTLKVTADGYDTWTRTLYVNSKEATIQITINDNTDSTGSDSSGTGTGSTGSSQATAQTPSETASERADEKNNQSTSQSTTGSSQSTNSSQGTDNKSSDSSGNSLTNKDISDYLSTLTSLLSSK
ncbi:MAG: PEGA domain-containing protein [Agathobacter sp.]|uniref:PEGA domain-containing protein n=1 Tax=Agathobacter sp. TaxID=2021311 RepID=UPI002E7869FD|nr:PEGA domain-containing protein [Agathobacter sp.]MEE1217421.1 PEGA domain-containing protein [Agathobacter sp.]